MMSSLKILTVFLMAHCVFADHFFEDCANPDDYERCRIEGFQKFFTKFSAGDSSKGMKPMDPMVLDQFDVPEETLKILFSYKKFVVNGLKDVTVTEFKKDADSNVAHIYLKYDYTAEGPLEFKLTKEDKSFSGTIKYEAGVTGSISYPFSIETVDGKKFAVIGQETFTCETTHVKSTIDSELKKSLENDQSALSLEGPFAKVYPKHQAKVACETTKAVFKNIIDNLRALLKSEAA